MTLPPTWIIITYHIINFIYIQAHVNASAFLCLNFFYKYHDPLN